MENKQAKLRGLKHPDENGGCVQSKYNTNKRNQEFFAAEIIHDFNDIFFNRSRCLSVELYEAAGTLFKRRFKSQLKMRSDVIDFTMYFLVQIGCENARYSSDVYHKTSVYSIES